MKGGSWETNNDMELINQILSIHHISYFLNLTIDLLLVWILFNCIITVVRKNLRTLQILKGILIILIIKLVASALNLHIFGNLVDTVLMWGGVSIIVIFQPEIRAALEKIGKANFTMSTSSSLDISQKNKIINEIVKTVNFCSINKVGALISFERTQSLQDYINSGTVLDAIISNELLLTIFYEGTMLHDGGVIIKGDRVACASAFYEPTSRELSPVYGARHRAALGLSEVSDALTIIVSEESGNVSFTKKGELIKVPLGELKERLIFELGMQDGCEVM